jgi:hypothetical protein
MWRPRGRTHAGMDGRHPGAQDASGDIHVGLDSSTPCWNDVIKDLELTEASLPSSKEITKDTKGSDILTDKLRSLHVIRGKPNYQPRIAA